METRTGQVEHEKETNPKTSTGRRPQSKQATWRGRGRSMVKWVTTPAANVWHDYLRDPVSTGLITTGALLTETGRLIRNSRKPQRLAKKSASEGPAEKKTDENILH